MRPYFELYIKLTILYRYKLIIVHVKIFFIMNNIKKDRSSLYEYSDGNKFKCKNTEQIFTEIAKQNFWESEGSISGVGSSLKQTDELINKILDILDKYKIFSIFDIPCGDYYWMKRIDLSEKKYSGGDIVKEIIKKNISLYKKNNIDFIYFDLIKDKIEQWDLVFCRDCFVHFSYEDIFKAIANIKSSKSKYLMTTTFSDEDKNKDIQTGGWRTLNLLKAPFNFPEPTYTLNEKCSEFNGIFSDKSLGLWEISQL